MISDKNYYSANGNNVDLNDAAAVENDETMIINSDNTVITTPIDSPREYGSGLDVKNKYDTTDGKLESDTPTSETSTSSMIDSMLGEQKQKKHCRTKMKKETNAKYAKKLKNNKQIELGFMLNV